MPCRSLVKNRRPLDPHSLFVPSQQAGPTLGLIPPACEEVP